MNRLMPGILMLSLSMAGAGELSVSIKNPPPEGMLEFVLFDSANAFGDNRDAVKSVRYAVASNGIYRVSDLPAGEYALLVYSDENENSLLDRNFIGIPREPLAYANGYRPKGPPTFQKAAFLLAAGESRHFDVLLEKPLGKFGRLGAGAGVIMRSSPYRDYDGDVSQVIPAVTYMGERVQIYGPEVQVGLLGSDKVRLGGKGRYRMAAYDVDDSPFLEGMEQPDGTLLLGLELIVEMPGGIDLSSGYSHDVLGRIGGGTAEFKLDKSFQVGTLRVSPRIGVSILSAELANEDFGVPAESANSGRTAYELDAAVSIDAGVKLSLELTRDWLLLLDTGVEFLPDEVTRSPIVSEDTVVGGFGVLSYLF